MSAQGVLFEPTGAEIGPMALGHVSRALKAEGQALIADSFGWTALAVSWRKQAKSDRFEADCLGMLAEFERLGRVWA